MYIIHETVAGNDPRLHPKMTRYANYWHYTIHIVPDNENIYVDWLNGEVISEKVAKAYKFCSSKNGEMSVRKSTTIYEEIESASSEADLGLGPKIIYELTLEDQQNAVELLRVIIKNFAKNRIQDPAKRQAAIDAANQATTVDQCNSVLGVHCNY